MGDYKFSALDQDIRDMQELNRMSSNPLLVAAMRKIVSAVDSKKTTANPQTSHRHTTRSGPTLFNPEHSVPQEGDRSAPNGLTPRTLEVIRAMQRPFTIPDVVAALKERGFSFVATKPKVAVAAPLKMFVKRGIVRLVKAGAGSEPHLYEYVGGEERAA